MQCAPAPTHAPTLHGESFHGTVGQPPSNGEVAAAAADNRTAPQIHPWAQTPAGQAAPAQSAVWSRALPPAADEAAKGVAGQLRQAGQDTLLRREFGLMGQRDAPV
jgi:hypothetical protein